MNMTIEIHYIGDSKIMQSGSFPLKGKSTVQVALDFWKQIQKEMSYRAKLEKVTLNGENDITDLVIELEKSEWRNIEQNWNLPF